MVETLGDRLKRLRLAAGYDSQNAFAQAVGVPPSRIRAIELGETTNPRRDTLEKIAAGLSVPIQTLINDGPDPSSQSLHWFWSARLAQLTTDQLYEMLGMPAIERVEWTINALLPLISLEDIATRTDIPLEHIQAFARGHGAAMPALIQRLTERLDLPPAWLLKADPGPLDDDMKIVMQSSEAGRYLRAIRRAIDERVSPELIERYLDILKTRTPSAD